MVDTQEKVCGGQRAVSGGTGTAGGGEGTCRDQRARSGAQAPNVLTAPVSHCRLRVAHRAGQAHGPSYSRLVIRAPAVSLVNSHWVAA